MTEHLLQDLHRQMDRARDLQAAYDELEGGWFGSAAITGAIRAAERSIEDGDPVAMLVAYHALEILE